MRGAEHAVEAGAPELAASRDPSVPVRVAAAGVGVRDYVPAPVAVCTLATGGLHSAPQRGEQVGVQRPQAELQQPGRRVPPGMERSYLVHVCVAPVLNVPIYSLHAERDGVHGAARDASLSTARSSAARPARGGPWRGSLARLLCRACLAPPAPLCLPGRAVYGSAETEAGTPAVLRHSRTRANTLPSADRATVPVAPCSILLYASAKERARLDSLLA